MKCILCCCFCCERANGGNSFVSREMQATSKVTFTKGGENTVKERSIDMLVSSKDGLYIIGKAVEGKISVKQLNIHSTC